MPNTTKKPAKKTVSEPVAATAPKAKKATKTTPKSTSVTSAKSPASKKGKAVESTVTVHHTSEPSATKSKVSKMGKSSLNSVRQPKFWLWLLGVIVVVFVGLVIWWQWQRSYVAVVGGQYLPVSMMDDQLRANYGNSGVNSIIQQQLIMQEATKQNIKITDKQIDAQMSKIVTSSGGQKSYDDQLNSLGISESLLRTQVEVQLMREVLLKDKIQVSDAEIQAYYDQNKATIDPDGTTGIAALKDQIAETLKQQKLDSATSDYVDSLKQRAHVETHLDHLSLTFGDFLQATIVPIPTNIWDFITGKK